MKDINKMSQSKGNVAKGEEQHEKKHNGRKQKASEDIKGEEQREKSKLNVAWGEEQREKHKTGEHRKETKISKRSFSN